ncbi:MAG: TonB family protein [Terriglobales bacterium]
MSYKALLFCPDEKTARVVTQVLSDLEFQVEACNEPFAAVKKLMAGHFDAVVVDCDNEQNATLLFKSARNSEFNQASLSVAVVEGQSGVAKAFRIGANLVLTKPINVEQSKGTLRVARGLLRKNEAAKTSAKVPGVAPRASIAPPSQPVSAPPVSIPQSSSFVSPAMSPAPSLTSAVTASSSSAFELEKDPTPEPEPTEAAFLESVPDPLANRSHAADQATPAPKQYPWQPIPKPMAEPMAEPMAQGMTTALKHTAEATNADSGITVGHGAAAAPAPAREPAEIDDEISAPELEEEPSGPPSSSAPAAAMPKSSGSSVNWGRIAAIVLVAAAAGAIYRAGTLTHWQMPSLSVLHQKAAPANPQAPAPRVTTPAPTPAPGPTTVPQNPSQNLTATGASLQKPSPATDATSLGTGSRKPAVTATSPDPPTVVRTFGEAGSDTIVVNTQTPKPAPPKPAAVETVEPTAPDAVSADSQSNDQAISGLMSMPSGVPQPGPETLRVSQGVSQGLLIKKVSPVYPTRALQTHTQGSVQLLATISKDGDITNVKLLSGETLLARAAMDAVKQWKYKPYYLNSQPMEIQTQITVNFTLP